MTSSALPNRAVDDRAMGRASGADVQSSRIARGIEWCARASIHFAKSFVLCAFTYLVMLTGYQACKWQPFFTPNRLPMTPVSEALASRIGRAVAALAA